jgi:hypothetical protein
MWIQVVVAVVITQPSDMHSIVVIFGISQRKRMAIHGTAIWGLWAAGDMARLVR